MGRAPKSAFQKSSREDDFPDLEDRFRAASAASNDCLWEWDLVTGEINRSEAMATRFGYPCDKVEPTTNWWRSRIHPDERQSVCDSFDRFIAEGTRANWTGAYRFRRSDGSYAEVLDRAYILRKGATVQRVVGAVIDVSEINETTRALQESEVRYRYTMEMTGQIAWSADAHGERIVFDDRWAALTGLSCSMAIDEWPLLAHPKDREPGLDRWRRSMESGESIDVEHRLRVADGSFRWFRTRGAAHKNTTDRVERWYGTIEDVHERKLDQLALRHLANFDELTELPNRHRFSTDLEAALGGAANAGRSVGLLVLDIDDFKTVNDLFGHDTGDDLLLLFASRMREAALNFYRLGGDEFALLGKDGSPASLFSAAETIHDLFRQPFHIGGTIMNCRASIGCALFPLHGNTASELLKSADIALYAAKAAGHGQTKLFASAMRSELQKRSSMLEVARRALVAGEVRAFFQPKISLQNGTVVGFEALMRICNTRFGPQQPAIIAAAFDHPELGLEIGDQILKEVTSIVKRWRRRGLNFGRIAINASPLEFNERNYADWILSRLSAEGVSATDIEVEVTETVFLGTSESCVLESLGQLKAAGVTIALDDFGTGFASLSHLRQYPVDVLKIDQSFVRELTTDSRQQQITKALIGLSRTMGIATVAEGIETADQAELLRSFGCDVGQGFCFGRAMAAQEAEDYLQTNTKHFRSMLEQKFRRH